MNRTTPERRANRRRKIAQRKRLLNSINKSWADSGVDFCEAAEIKDGYLDNNNEMNKHSYKTKSKHDQRQVDSMDEQEIDIDNLTAPLCDQ